MNQVWLCVRLRLCHRLGSSRSRIYRQRDFSERQGGIAEPLGQLRWGRAGLNNKRNCFIASLLVEVMLLYRTDVKSRSTTIPSNVPTKTKGEELRLRVEVVRDIEDDG